MSQKIEISEKNEVENWLVLKDFNFFDT